MVHNTGSVVFREGTRSRRRIATRPNPCNSKMVVCIDCGVVAFRSCPRRLGGVGRHKVVASFSSRLHDDRVLSLVALVGRFAVTSWLVASPHVPVAGSAWDCFGQVGAGRGQYSAGFGQVWVEFGQMQVGFNQARTGLGLFLAGVGNTCVGFDQNWDGLEQYRAEDWLRRVQDSA